MTEPLTKSDRDALWARLVLDRAVELHWCDLLPDDATDVERIDLARRVVDEASESRHHGLQVQKADAILATDREARARAYPDVKAPHAPRPWPVEKARAAALIAVERNPAIVDHELPLGFDEALEYLLPKGFLDNYRSTVEAAREQLRADAHELLYGSEREARKAVEERHWWLAPQPDDEPDHHGPMTITNIAERARAGAA